MKKKDTQKPRIARTEEAWYVIWYVDGKRCREKGGLNKIENLEDREAAAQSLLRDITAKLEGKQVTTPKHKAVPLLLSLRRFLRRKADTARKSTMQTYTSKFRQFEKWAVSQQLADTDIRSFTEDHARAFMRSVSTRQPTTYNHYHDLLSSLFDAAIEEKVLTKNPFEKHERRKITPTPALYFPDEIRDRLAERIDRMDPQLYLFTQFIYSCFIRPEELRQIRVQDLRLSERRIWVDGKISKNRIGAYVVIPNRLAGLIEAAGLLEGEPGEYLFTLKGIPGPVPVGKNYMKTRHRKHLIDLGLDPEQYKLYSWKHTGAVNAIRKGVNVADLMNQLRHHDLNETQGYLRQMNVESSAGLLEGW